MFSQKRSDKEEVTFSRNSNSEELTVSDEHEFWVFKNIASPKKKLSQAKIRYPYFHLDDIKIITEFLDDLQIEYEFRILNAEGSLAKFDSILIQDGTLSNSIFRSFLELEDKLNSKSPIFGYKPPNDCHRFSLISFGETQLLVQQIKYSKNIVIQEFLDASGSGNFVFRKNKSLTGGVKNALLRDGDPSYVRHQRTIYFTLIYLMVIFLSFIVGKWWFSLIVCLIFTIAWLLERSSRSHLIWKVSDEDFIKNAQRIKLLWRPLSFVAITIISGLIYQLFQVWIF